jgi:predicted ArsR family transcriptional regulator
LLVLTTVDELLQRWTTAVGGLRADAGARRLVPLLPRHPVVNAQIVADALAISDPSARTAISHLETLGILEEFDAKHLASRPGRPAQWWVAGDLLALLGR